ncbi:hypothetical protein AX14_008327 [Amanita brunnescens Koide BX004]|nr:hypothetical protein AX14_008327 [Amanita brunnescens Koide BX004]
MLLQPDGSPIHVGLTPNSARVRHPVPPSYEDSDISTFQQRVRDRDPCCLIIGSEAQGTYTGFRETHIFPPGHESKACRIIFF